MRIGMRGLIWSLRMIGMLGRWEVRFLLFASWRFEMENGEYPDCHRWLGSFVLVAFNSGRIQGRDR